MRRGLSTISNNTSGSDEFLRGSIKKTQINAPRRSIRGSLASVVEFKKQDNVPKFSDYTTKCSFKAKIFFALIFYLIACLGQISIFIILNYIVLILYNEEGERQISLWPILRLLVILATAYIFVLISFHMITNSISKNIGRYFHSKIVSTTPLPNNSSKDSCQPMSTRCSGTQPGPSTPPTSPRLSLTLTTKAHRS